MKSTTEKSDMRVNVMSSNALQKKIDENRHILRQIVGAVVYLGKQGITFRGKIENITSTKNPGNFLALLKSYAERDTILFNHLYHTNAKNATHLSPTTQNEIINIIGYDIILANIISEAKQAVANYFSVLADELSCHNTEYLPICIRFVDSLGDIREDFLSFIKLDRVRAVDIASAIVQTLEEFGLSLDDLRGQGYDGASTMSGEITGVQARIKEKQPKALYTHCAGHSFNLAILDSCTVPPIRNCVDIIKAFTLWVKHSAKREGLLKKIIEKRSQIGTKQQSLLNVCVTRWVENIDGGWQRFSQYHPFLIEMGEVIIYGNSEFESYNDGWNAEDKKNSLAHLKALE